MKTNSPCSWGVHIPEKSLGLDGGLHDYSVIIRTKTNSSCGLRKRSLNCLFIYTLFIFIYHLYIIIAVPSGFQFGSLYSDLHWHLNFTFWLILPAAGGKFTTFWHLNFLFLTGQGQSMQVVMGYMMGSTHNAAWRQRRALIKLKKSSAKIRIQWLSFFTFWECILMFTLWKQFIVSLCSVFYYVTVTLPDTHYWKGNWSIDQYCLQNNNKNNNINNNTRYHCIRGQ